MIIHKEENIKHQPEVKINKDDNKITLEIDLTKHPNEIDHAVQWIEVWFKDENQEPIEIGRVNFSSHDKIKSIPKITLTFDLNNRKGKLSIISYCNKHGIWEKEISIE